MTAVVLIPYQAGPCRSEALHYVWNRLADDGWPVVIGEPEQSRWCKASAVAEAVAVTERRGHPDDVLIIHDADVLVDLASLRLAVEQIETGQAGWAIPHQLVLRLSERATEAVYAGTANGDAPDLVRAPYVGMPGGGCVVLARSTYEDCPLDRRFVTWGDEDQCFGWALGTLYGAAWRAVQDLTHLWHPHPAPGAQHSANIDSNRLRRAYRAYRADETRMRALVHSGR